MPEEEFSKDQLDFLQSEFDRQKEMIIGLSIGESEAKLELDRIKNSISYRLGRALTLPLRKISSSLTQKKEERFESGVLESVIEEAFPELHISPQLVPRSKNDSFGMILIQEFLTMMRDGRPSANAVRDHLKGRSRSIDQEVMENSIFAITRYILANFGHQSQRASFFLGAFRYLILNNEMGALRYYDEFRVDIPEPRADKEMVVLLMKMGEIRRPYSIITKIGDSGWKAGTIKDLEAQITLLENGFEGEVFSNHQPKLETGKVMYCASQCLPHASNGYAIRTHEVVKGISSNGRDVTVCARHGYPLDRSDFRGEYEHHENVIEQIEYMFNPSGREDGVPEIDYTKVFNFTSFGEYQDIYASTLLRQAEIVKPEIIHAASNFVVGMAAVNVAKALEIPAVYEIRGFWHETQASKRPGYRDSDHYNLSESMEIEVAKRADFVFTITQAIADILIEYGIESQKIRVLPNCVDTDEFIPMERKASLEEKYELFDKVVIGYIGSFVDYEGLDILLDAISLIKEEVGEYLKVILVGDGPELSSIKELTKQLEIEDLVIFTGRIPHDEVRDYYSVIDITPFPRRGRRVCEIVSPLKPFEALAMGKAVIVSDVAALDEIIQNGETGLVHLKDDIPSLARCLKELVLDDRYRRELSKNGRKWVAENRTWKMAGETVEEVYRILL